MPPGTDEVESLVAEAERRAWQLVCDELAGQLAARYRAALVARMGGSDPGDPPEPVRRQPPSAPAAASAADEGNADTAWYLYAIVRADDVSDADLADLSGVEGGRVELVTTDDLAAVTAEVPLAGFRTCGDEPDLSPDGWLPQAARAHERVAEWLCSRVTALPFRFGVLYPSRDHTRAVLRTCADQLRGELDRLDNAAEWGVKAYLTEAATRDQPPPAADATDGTEWMLRRREAAAARQEDRRLRARIAIEIEEALSPYAREAVVRASSRTGESISVVFDAVYLVSHQDDEGFAEALHRVGSLHSHDVLRMELTGPWPPYHFVRLDADVVTGAPGTAGPQPDAPGVRLPGPRVRHGAAP